MGQLTCSESFSNPLSNVAPDLTQAQEPFPLWFVKAPGSISEKAGISSLSRPGSRVGHRYPEGLASYDSALKFVWRQEGQLLELDFFPQGKTLYMSEQGLPALQRGFGKRALKILLSMFPRP